MPRNYNSSLKENSDIGQFVRKSESDWTGGTTSMSKYVDMNIHEDISTIYAYLDSKHISGPTDSQGREKPFFNIVLAARNIWYRATDIDRSNIKIRSTKSSHDLGAFLATCHLQDWMRRERFGAFLNSWGLNSAAFNETVLKFVEKDGRLMPSVVPWSRFICDVVDFRNNPKIEILEFTPAQLRKQTGYDPEMVKQLIEAVDTRENTDGQQKDNKTGYIKLYEVHGEFPMNALKEEGSQDEYRQQIHVISFLADKEGKYHDYTLFSGIESRDPYRLGALVPEVDGSISLRGSVKTLFDAQWMQNHSIKAIKDNVDLATKLLYQTADSTFFGQNVLNSIQNGDILIHKPNMPLTLVANDQSDLTALQNFRETWKQLGNEIVGVSDAMLGKAPKSGTPWRQTEAILQENHDLFELMTENKGLTIEEVMRDFVIPFIKKKLDTTDEVAATLSAYDIEKIDSRFIKGYSINKTNKAIKELLLSGKNVTPDDQQMMTDMFARQAQGILEGQGKQRFFAPSELPDKTWKMLFEDLEWDVEVDITNENVDKDAATTLNSLLAFFARKQGQPLTPEEKFTVNKILQFTGTVSPIELSNLDQNRAEQTLNNPPVPGTPGANAAPMIPQTGAAPNA